MDSPRIASWLRGLNRLQRCSGISEDKARYRILGVLMCVYPRRGREADIISPFQGVLRGTRQWFDVVKEELVANANKCDRHRLLIV